MSMNSYFVGGKWLHPVDTEIVLCSLRGFYLNGKQDIFCNMLRPLLYLTSWIYRWNIIIFWDSECEFSKRSVMCLVDGCPFAFVNIFLPYCCWKAEPCSIFKFTRDLSYVASVLLVTSKLRPCDHKNYAKVEIHPYPGCQRLACVQYLKRNVGSRKKTKGARGKLALPSRAPHFLLST